MHEVPNFGMVPLQTYREHFTEDEDYQEETSESDESVYEEAVLDPNFGKRRSVLYQPLTGFKVNHETGQYSCSSKNIKKVCLVIVYPLLLLYRFNS